MARLRIFRIVRLAGGRANAVAAEVDDVLEVGV